MSPSSVSPLSTIEALTFDVFGTVVDWRSTVVEELTLRAFRKLSTELEPRLKSRLEAITEKDWATFAQQWRNSYKTFCSTFNAEHDAWKSVDQHHHDSLIELLNAWELGGLYSSAEIQSLSLVWHRLNPWPDSPEGVQKLGELTNTATLSNGNAALVRDLNDFGGLGFHLLLSAETFRAYKPNAVVYHGAVERLGAEPGQVAMVAAHLSDLQAARSCGLRTIYVERPHEEDWGKDEDRYKDATQWVDMWVTHEEGGLLEVARRLDAIL
ncbi:haloacid dehalogenase type II [Paramyrothecium foliicola]|nr:haloacid dehalogenase type II [Paramyrothecium foliicola]